MAAARKSAVGIGKGLELSPYLMRTVVPLAGSASRTMSACPLRKEFGSLFLPPSPAGQSLSNSAALDVCGDRSTIPRAYPIPAQARAAAPGVWICAAGRHRWQRSARRHRAHRAARAASGSVDVCRWPTQRKKYPARYSCAVIYENRYIRESECFMTDFQRRGAAHEPSASRKIGESVQLGDAHLSGYRAVIKVATYFRPGAATPTVSTTGQS